MITDGTLLQELLDSLEEPMVESEADKAPASPRRSPMDSPKRSGGEGDVEDERPKRMARSTPQKMQKTRSEKDEPEAASASSMTVLMPPGKDDDLDGIPLLTTKLVMY